ncbi:class I SAM-dependent methyltransferase [Thalassobaculum litoreum]|uniref:Methyltransferase domain-containing protein n=1 Tax=Thalassobaculum litoreum DSM 18839 TaxID=1123362 RepID=A0A8G2EXA8_9PROT|nr:class I SAM-dependent methyltransferase [Thalassobaculum litoreum]SDG59296.1 Methyltransferase domain-containing protein [Thalassobaculum litoreum DSM 18839]
MSMSPPLRSVDEFMSAQAELLDGITILDRSCPICGSSNSSTKASRFSLGQWPIKECHRCTMVYITRAPDQAALIEDYDWNKSTKLEDQWRDSSRPVIETLHRRLRWRSKILRRPSLAQRLAETVRSGPVIDVGCGDGAELATLPRTFTAIGIEISASSADRAKQKLAGRPVEILTNSALEGLKSLESNSCSGAVLRSYLEHEADPRAVVEELGRVLIEGGVALVKVPNFASLNRVVMGKKWCGFRHPDHLNYFTPNTLRLIGRVGGFDARFKFFDALPTDDNVVVTYINTKRPHQVYELLGTGSQNDTSPTYI